MQRVSIIGISLVSVASVGALCVLGNLQGSRTYADEPASARAAVAPRFVVSAAPVNARTVAAVNGREVQVQLQVKLVELHLDKLREQGLRIEELLGDLAKPEREGTSRVGCFSTDVLEAHLTWLRATKSGKILAEPTLLVHSGRQGNFLSGGEIPVAQNGGRVIEYRAFGTTICATPTVQADGNIRLDVAVENSQRDFSQTVKVNDAVVPGLVSRKWQFQADVPGAQSLAMLSVSGENRRELVVVTPRIVERSDAPSAALSTREAVPLAALPHEPGVSLVTVSVKPVTQPACAAPTVRPGEAVGHAVVDGGTAMVAPSRDEGQILAGIQRLQLELELLRERVKPQGE